MIKVKINTICILGQSRKPGREGAIMIFYYDFL